MKKVVARAARLLYPRSVKQPTESLTLELYEPKPSRRIAGDAEAVALIAPLLERLKAPAS